MGENQKNIILTFRWLTLLLLILILLSGEEGLRLATRGYALAVLFFTSNLILYFLPPQRFRSTFWTSFILIADIVFITFAIYISGKVRGDLYLVYFLTIFTAALGRALRGSIVIGVMACILYGWLFSRQATLKSLFYDTSFLVRIPFLFLSSIFTGFLSQQAQTARAEKEREAYLTSELSRRLEIAIKMEEKSHQDLVAANEYKENILRSLTSGVIVVNSSGKVTTFNKAAQKITGLTTKEVIGVPIQEISNCSLDNLKNLLLVALDSGNLSSGAEVEIDLGYKRIPVGVTTSILHNNSGEPSGAIAVFHDLSEKRRLEEKVKHSERWTMLGKMAAAVAHELRNPLNSIAGFAQLLMEMCPEEDRRREYSRIIIEEVERINLIIEDILDFGGQKKPDFLPTDLNLLLKDLLLSLEQKARERGVKISCDLAKGLPLVLADCHQLRQVFLNLLHNCLEAMPEVGNLKVRTQSRDNYVEIAVSDTGTGIASENKDKIFELFFTTKRAGTGLGLWVSQEIVKNHHGEIRVESEVGKGSTFTVVLPHPSV